MATDIHSEAAEAPAYRGRFAPTPSGPLHLGSLLTALASYLQARSAGGTWLLRIDDLDTQRSRAEHAGTILQQLAAHGLVWDEPVRWQSRHCEEYERAFQALRAGSDHYPCHCTRAQLAQQSLGGVDGPVYAGTCRSRREPSQTAAWRIAMPPGRIELHDPWQGSISRDLQADIGDFIVRRADGQIGYQLACVVDEQAQRITEVVRGADLIGSTLRQRYLQQKLHLDPPAYRHLPVLGDASGLKLSKQNHAPTVDGERAVPNLFRCLGLLGQNPPPALVRSSVDEILACALAQWNPGLIPRLQQLPVPA